MFKIIKQHIRLKFHFIFTQTCKFFYILCKTFDYKMNHKARKLGKRVFRGCPQDGYTGLCFADNSRRFLDIMTYFAMFSFTPRCACWTTRLRLSWDDTYLLTTTQRTHWDSEDGLGLKVRGWEVRLGRWWMSRQEFGWVWGTAWTKRCGLMVVINNDIWNHIQQKRR